MHTQEPKISPRSSYYIYTPGLPARRLYLYPLSIGHFYYEPGYCLRRNRFDSYLLMYIVRNSCRISSSSFSGEAGEGQFVLLDCYQPHSYGSSVGFEVYWMHFDGPLAGAYFEEITRRTGSVFSSDARAVLGLEQLFDTFQGALPIQEAALSRKITELLDSFLSAGEDPCAGSSCSPAVTDAISYISYHFAEDITLKSLAERVSLSPYYFIRLFSRETGFTPYQYLMNTRLSAARFLLQSPDLSVKDVSVRTGFHSESSFCTCFKKAEKMTPGQYRAAVLAKQQP